MAVRARAVFLGGNGAYHDMKCVECCETLLLLCNCSVQDTCIAVQASTVSFGHEATSHWHIVTGRNSGPDSVL